MNRQQRRQMERNMRKTGQRVTNAPKPTGEFGVEVDRVNDKIVFTLNSGNVSTTAEWGVTDARYISNMIQRAADEDEREKKVEVVRQSGIVVAKQLPGG